MDDLYIPKTQKALFANGVLWIIGILLLVALIGGAVWGFQVAFASPAGKGGAYRQKESALNRVQKQEMFQQLNADIDGYIAKIGVAKAAVKTSPSEFNRTNLVGIQQQCIDTAQQYNAESHKYTSRDFKSANLPYARNPTECR